MIDAGRANVGKNKYCSKEEKIKLIKEHLENNISTNEITTREKISNGNNNDWIKNEFINTYIYYYNKALDYKTPIQYRTELGFI